MPVRLTIHSGSKPWDSRRSSLVTTRSGTALPVERIWTPVRRCVRGSTCGGPLLMGDPRRESVRVRRTGVGLGVGSRVERGGLTARLIARKGPARPTDWECEAGTTRDRRIGPSLVPNHETHGCDYIP